MFYNTVKGFNIRHLQGTIFIIISLLLLFTCSCQNKDDGGEAEVIKLKFSSGYVPTDWPNEVATHVLDLVEEKTGGRVKIDRYVGGVLGSIPEHLDLVSSGAVDIVPLQVDQFSQKLPLHKIFNSEQFVSDEQGLENIKAVTEEILETKAILDAELQKNNIKMLTWNLVGPSGITVGFPADSIDDLKGKKINVITAFQRKVYRELGIIPVNVQVSELYEALSRGIIDAIYMATVAAVPSKWYEVGESHLILGENTVCGIPFTMNLDTWNNLPRDIQEAFREASEETSQWSIEQIHQKVQDSYEIFEKADVEVIILSQEESKGFYEVFSRYATEEWLENAQKMGVGDEAAVIQKYWDDMKWGR